jgi:hypothetical protein
MNDLWGDLGGGGGGDGEREYKDDLHLSFLGKRQRPFGASICTFVAGPSQNG